MVAIPVQVAKHLLWTVYDIDSYVTDRRACVDEDRIVCILPLSYIISRSNHNLSEPINFHLINKNSIRKFKCLIKRMLGRAGDLA